MLIELCIVFIATHIGFVAFGFFALLFSRKHYTYLSAEPFVSVLVAARNEEENLPRLLASLQKLNYPAGNLEILIGDDSSEDRTYAIAASFSQKYANTRVIRITQNLGQAKGKSNVLAQLAREAKGEVFFIADADMEMNPDWIRGHLSVLENRTALSSGSTLVRSQDYWSHIQYLESVYLMGVYHTVESLHPVTAMGNNMCITREAYEATDGYGNLPFSLIEDYQIMQEAQKKGYRHRQVLDHSVLGWSAPVPDLKAFIRQRKRWMLGIASQPWYLWILFGLYGLYLPVLLFLFFLSWKLALLMIIVKMIVDFSFLQVVFVRLKLPWNPLWLPVIECCLMGLNTLMTFSAFFGKKVEWKGRTYAADA